MGRIEHMLNAFDKIEDCYGLLERETFNLAIVDLNHEDSDVLLAFLKTHYAHIVRLTLVDSLFTSDISQVKQHKHSQLSWQKNQDVQELMGMIDKLIDIDERINNSDLLNLVSSLKRLPTLPKFYFELTKQIEEN